MIRKREREKDPYLGHLPVAGPASARPVTVQPSCQSSSSPSPRSSCVLDARAPTPATSCFAVAASPTSSRRHGDVPDPLSLLPRSLDLPPPRSSVSPPATERSRRHRREPPWLPATPRLTDAPGSSAGPPSTSSTSHEAPDVPQHRPRCLLQPRDRRPSSSNSPAPDRPRPRRASPRHRRESLTLSPNSACSPPCRSAVPHEHRSHRPPLLLHA